MRRKNLGALGALVLLAAGCAAGDGPGFIGGATNYAAGAALGGELGGRESEALAGVFRQSMERGAEGERAVWSSGEWSGSVTPGRYLAGNLKPDPATRLPVDPAVDLSESYETELGLFAVTGTANLRAGPSTEARVLDQLQGGEAVDVVGRVVGKPWMLVARGDAVGGYVHESLLVRAPGAELTLAGGPTRRAWRCRDFNQTLSNYGRTERWSGVACDRGEGWRLETAPREEPLAY